MEEHPRTAPLDLSGYRLRRNWMAPGLALAIGLAGLWQGGGVGVVVALIAGTFAVAAPRRNAFPLARPVRLRVVDGALLIDDVPFASAGEIVEVRRVARRAGRDETSVELVARDDRVLQLGLDEATATQLLAGLGLGAGARRARFRWRVPFAARFYLAFLLIGLPWLGAVIALPTSWDIWLWPSFFLLMLLAAAGAVVLGFLHGTILVGSEGIALRWLRRRHVPFADVREVKSIVSWHSPDCVDTLLVLAGGKRLRIATPETPATEDELGTEGRALHTHVEAAFLAYLARGAGEDGAAHVAREGRSARAWRDGLAALATQGSYRAASLEPARLLALARDPVSRPDVRVGAAAALLSSEPGHAGAVRVAAEACADPETRAALLALAEAEGEDDVVRALERVAR